MRLETRAADAAEWDAYWLACRHATFFESRWWADVWSQYQSGRARPAALMVSFPDGTRAVLPSTVEDQPPGLKPRTRLAPADTYGSWLSPHQLSGAHAAAIRAFVLRRGSHVRWLENPFLVDPTRPISMDTHTLAIDLTKGNDEVRKGWSKGNRSAAAKAIREGVTIRVATQMSDWNAYFMAYQDSIRRWGDKATSKYSWPLFDRLARLESPYVRLWLAEYDQLVIAGALCLYHPRQVSYWHGATLEEYFKLRPANLLLQTAIMDACDRGATWFDMGPSGGHAGVESFKRHFGATALPITVTDTAPTVARVARKLRRLIRTGIRRVRG